ncbi:hypothetical protein, partial [Klebsiella sp. T11]|uniref:hypothetical protein n=1 Tax=Klebsiella sp. T11 TaxID=2057803 RepID=UPI00197DB5A8
LPLRAFSPQRPLSASSASSASRFRNSSLHLFCAASPKTTKAATIFVAASSPFRQHPSGGTHRINYSL